MNPFQPSPQLRVLVFASQKGGSGKTTLAGHIAVEAERQGAGPVALIDCIRDCEMSPDQIRRVAKGSKRIVVRTERKRTMLEYV